MAKKKKQQKEEQLTKPIKKRGFFGTILHLILVLIKFFVGGFLVSLLVAGVICFFIYNYYPIKTFDLCVNRTATVSNMACISSNECLTKLMNQSQNQMPEIVKGLMSNFMAEFVKCGEQWQCEVRMPRGFDQSPGTCAADEDSRQLKFYLKDIIPLNQIIPTVQQFVTTGKLPFSQ